MRCVENDECRRDEDNCDVNAKCSNTVGSFTCACVDGFTGNGTHCVDVDECSNAYNNPCSRQALCKNTFGSYTCACGHGFTGILIYIQGTYKHLEKIPLYYIGYI